MSELTTTRIRAAAERLGLTHLPEQVTTMAARAEADQLGYLASSTSSWARKSPCASNAGSATP
jgi:hypothetical protein